MAMSLSMHILSNVRSASIVAAHNYFSAKTIIATRGKHGKFFDDPGAPKVAVCKDGQTIAMYHPPKAVCYEKTIPIPRDDPRYSAFDNLNDLVRHKLEESGAADRAVEEAHIEHGWPLYDRELVPTVMELSNMFYLYKYESFYHGDIKKRKKNPPVNRPAE